MNLGAAALQRSFPRASDTGDGAWLCVNHTRHCRITFRTIIDPASSS